MCSYKAERTVFLYEVIIGCVPCLVLEPIHEVGPPPDLNAITDTVPDMRKRNIAMTADSDKFRNN